MKKYTQIKFDRSDSIYYIETVLKNLLLNHKDCVYVVYRDTGFNTYRYYLLFDVLFSNQNMIFFIRDLNIGSTSAALITGDMIINKNVRIFVDES